MDKEEIIDFLMKNGDGITDRLFNRLMGNEETWVIVEKGIFKKRIVGFGSRSINGVIRNVAVDPKYRRKKYATFLNNKLWIPNARVFVRVDNFPIKKLLNKMFICKYDPERDQIRRDGAKLQCIILVKPWKPTPEQERLILEARLKKTEEMVKKLKEIKKKRGKEEGGKKNG